MTCTTCTGLWSGDTYYSMRQIASWADPYFTHTPSSIVRTQANNSPLQALGRPLTPPAPTTLSATAGVLEWFVNIGRVWKGPTPCAQGSGSACITQHIPNDGAKELQSAQYFLFLSLSLSQQSRTLMKRSVVISLRQPGSRVEHGVMKPAPWPNSPGFLFPSVLATPVGTWQMTQSSILLAFRGSTDLLRWHCALSALARLSTKKEKGEDKKKRERKKDFFPATEPWLCHMARKLSLFFVRLSIGKLS